MHFAYNSLVAIIAAANSVDGGNSSRRTVAETSAQLQFTEESAGDFILNHFRSGDPGEEIKVTGAAPIGTAMATTS